MFCYRFRPSRFRASAPLSSSAGGAYGFGLLDMNKAQGGNKSPEGDSHALCESGNACLDVLLSFLLTLALCVSCTGT